MEPWNDHRYESPDTPYQPDDDEYAEHTLLELIKERDELNQWGRNDAEYAHASQYRLAAVVAEMSARRTLNAPANSCANKTYRFWTWVCDGWVRIKLKPEQTLTWGCHEPHEEGYSATCICWEHDGETITEHYATYGSDCDGRHQDNRTTFHHVADHSVFEVYDGELDTHGNVIRVPAWQQGECSQYDEFAELAGY